jgi:hypothetical protein
MQMRHAAILLLVPALTGRAESGAQRIRCALFLDAHNAFAVRFLACMQLWHNMWSYEVFVIIVLGPEHGDQRFGMRSFAIFGILMAATPVFAQNGFSATYDSARQVTFKGPVTTIKWTNPHAFIVVNVEDAPGVLTSWAVEIGNPLDLEKDGWKPDSVRIGDMVNVDGAPARGTSPQAFAKTVTLTRTGAKVCTIGR